MSVAKGLRAFLLADEGITITQIEEGVICELSDPDEGFIWFGRSSTERGRTFEQATGHPEQQIFDIEIYHPDPDVIESHAEAIHMMDCYRGAFGDGTCQGIFIESQSDDYVPRVQFTDAESFNAAFFQLEVRSYK